MRDLRQFARLHASREADHAEVRRMHAQQRARLGADGAPVVGGAGAVGRADLAQPRARALHDLGDPEPVADLHQLPARDHDLAPAGQRRECQHERRCAVVHADRGLGARQLAHERGDVILPRAAPAGGQVELEVRIAAGDRLHAGQRGFGQRRPAEIRVQHDARGVEHRAQRRLECGPHAAAQLRRQRARRRMLSAGPALGQRGTRLAHAERVRRVARRLAHEHVNGRQRADHGHIVRSCPCATGRRGEAIVPLRGTLPFGRGSSNVVRVQGRRPRQQHAGALI